MQQTAASGVLYVVATPIGNLQDITLRALEVLRAVDCIAAEDTRHSKLLLNHFAMQKPMLSLHDFNEETKSEKLIVKLQNGENIALISDAGTPLISDPGYRLLQLVIAKGIKVVPIPGVCAAISALSVSGLPTDQFVFAGFLPAKKSARRQRLQQLVAEQKTLIFYESPHRLLAMLGDLKDIFGAERKMVLAKELTKQFETIYRAPIDQVIVWLNADKKRQKGEFVILVHGKKESAKESISFEAKRILQILAQELSHKQAVKLTAEITGERKNRLYVVQY